MAKVFDVNEACCVPVLKEKKDTTSLIYVKDLSQGILQAALSPKTKTQIYYLTDGKGYSWQNIISILKKYVLGESSFLPLPEELIYFFAWLADVLNETGLLKSFFGRKLWRAMTQTLWLFSSIKAEKDFDLLVIPGGGHGMGGAYGQRRMQDFFVRHLLGVEPPDRNAAGSEGTGL